MGPFAPSRWTQVLKDRTVFVAAEQTVEVPCDIAVARLASMTAGGDLDRASHTAYQRGLTDAIRAGTLGAAAVVSKLVEVRFLDPVQRGEATRVGFRWEATGPAAGLFPVLDADITLIPAGNDRTRLALAGSYRPPLGRLGAGLDKVIFRRAAEATMRALVTDVAAALTRPTPASAAGLPTLHRVIVDTHQQWVHRMCNRALAAWLRTPAGAQESARAIGPPVSVRPYEDGGVRYIVISGPGAGVRAVYRISTDSRIYGVRAWPEGLTGC
jgi:hypothetical protein